MTDLLSVAPAGDRPDGQLRPTAAPIAREHVTPTRPRAARRDGSRPRDLGGSHLGSARTLGACLDLELDTLAADEAVKIQ